MVLELLELIPADFTGCSYVGVHCGTAVSNGTGEWFIPSLYCM